MLSVCPDATCFIGPHRIYDPWTKSFMNLIPGQGHFGPDAIPGDARWRRGESVSLKTARDTMERSAQAPTLAPTFPLLLAQALTQKLALVRCPWSWPSTPRWSTRPAERPFRSKEDARSQRHGQPYSNANAALFARVFYSLGRWCKRSFSNRCCLRIVWKDTFKTQSYKEFRLRMSRLCSVRHMPVRCPLAATAVPWWLEVPVLAAATASAARTARAVRPLLPPPVSPFP